MRRRSVISVLLNLTLLILKLFISIDFAFTHSIWTLLSLVGGEGDTFRGNFNTVMPAEVGELKLMVSRLHIAWIANVIGHCVFYQAVLSFELA